jgi:hypothetical protein
MKEEEMAFIALLEQAGEGCDYSIRCGLQVFRLKASTRFNAIKELRDIVVKYRGDDELEKVILFDVLNEQEMPVSTWYQEDGDAQEIMDKNEKEKKEREEYEKLKKKFEKK